MGRKDVRDVTCILSMMVHAVLVVITHLELGHTIVDLRLNGCRLPYDAEWPRSSKGKTKWHEMIVAATTI